jgi:HK97 gp10 family phage protein
MSASHNFSAADIMAANIEGIQRGLNVAMTALQKEMRLTLNKKGTGVGYRGGKKGKGYFRKRSAPFNPPAQDTSHLINSVQTSVFRNETGRDFVSVFMTGLVAGVDKDARIPRWLEYGTRYMHKRPFAAPSIKVVKPKAVGMIEQQMDKAIKRMRTRALKAAQ